MAARKAEEVGYKFSIYEGEKWIRISEIVRTTDWHRSSIERKIKEGILKTKKVGIKLYISWDSYLAWQRANG